MTNSKLELSVGSFVMLGILAFAFLALQASNFNLMSYNSTYNLIASFDDVGGLKTNSPVKSAGITVGRVKKISFNNKTFLADVIISIDKKIVLPVDTSASILTSGILGEQYIALIPGSEENTMLDNNGIIIYTQNALSLETLVGKLFYYFIEKEEAFETKDMIKKNEYFIAH
ncbi:ABC transport system substrate-binding protein [Candidatus Kinetoplastibacterium desouzaii TCC079E]|uniref:ABC transport system substrate-binding protein n=1 Tax=Candidatus Kinetoplastidibacterium desouzai TCC079E TaxID=1208919 RepID=M1LLF7_9PROT|nr:outer membrane lipid asymmetry maintenance protein MlaD [Candidatus Kinetoplastibacterium desouzaii]AGF46592.1 ABC transport system substrate-binding protein [Candidatus Kinetoplastibacterium desouzaii TCC079E]